MSKTLRSKALVLIQKLARIAAADDHGYAKCWSCGIHHHYKEMDGGHFFPKGNCSFWALEKEGVHPQCKGCNGFGMKYGIAAQQYTLSMIDYYGRDFVNEMEAKKRNVKKICKAEYQEMIEEFKAEIKFHEKRIGNVQN